MACLAETGRDQEQQEDPGLQQVEDAERRMPGRVVARRLGLRQQQTERHQHGDAGEADIEHPGGAVAVDGHAADQRAQDEGHRAPDAQAAVIEAARLGLGHQHAVIERHGGRPHAAPHQAHRQDGKEAVGELVAGQQDGGRARQHQDDAARVADPMRHPADGERGGHAHELAAHEQRADLGVVDAAVAQPYRPVAHEGAGREEVGRAVAGKPDAGDPARHQAPNSRRTSAVC